MNHTPNQSSNVRIAWYLLYYTFGLVPILVGADKFFHYIVDWYIYLNAQIPLLLGISPRILIGAVGIIEIAAGILLLLKPRLGAYIVCAWLLVITIELVTLGYYDIALRDVGLAVGAYVLALLSKELNK